ncbi:dienelactone hydrolase family protein [Paenibacillus sp. KN14-4R]|uniref:dienelactone hydrolase family protein n=1 Tax=Paenibacillus sp. KN14-4R TaxID=3445773 RepID=UPI003F9F275E
MQDHFSKKTLVIILHEIYGVNDHILDFKALLLKEGFDVLTPDLLHGRMFSLEQEEQAYRHFVNDIGFSAAVTHVQQIVSEHREKYGQIYLFGFSIGATMAWLCSNFGVDGVIGFYGSRIRNHIEQEPACPTLLFFATNEKSFDVRDLANQLQGKKNTELAIVDADHGFMNPFYKTYSPDQHRQCVEQSIDFLKQLLA